MSWLEFWKELDAKNAEALRNTKQPTEGNMGPSVAEQMFNAYNEQGPNPWKTFDGRDVPRWDAITDQVRAKWEAAAGCAQAIFVPTSVQAKP